MILYFSYSQTRTAAHKIQSKSNHTRNFVIPVINTAVMNVSLFKEYGLLTCYFGVRG